jgi:hypothetical protein
MDATLADTLATLGYRLVKKEDLIPGQKLLYISNARAMTEETIRHADNITITGVSVGPKNEIMFMDPHMGDLVSTDIENVLNADGNDLYLIKIDSQSENEQTKRSFLGRLWKRNRRKE